MQTVTLSADQILPPLVPMRDDVDNEALRELAADIRSRGLLQPLIVTPDGDKFRLVAGSRRWQAAQDAGLTEIPCVVTKLDEEGQLTAMVAENLHRVAPTPLDEARVFAVLQEALGKTVMEIAGIVHKSREYVAARLRVLHGPDDIREALRDGQISLSVALELERCTHDGDRKFLLSHAVSGGATTDMVRRWVQEAQLQRRTQPATAGTAAAVFTSPQPAVLMVTCEWHREGVAMEQSLSFRVCGPCFAFLTSLRERMAHETGADHEPHTT